MNQIVNNSKKATVLLGFFLVGLFPLQLFAEVSLWDRKDNIPPRAWIGRPIATGPIGQETINISSGKEVVYRTFFNEQHLIGDIVYESVAGNTNKNPLPDWASPAGRLLARDWETREIFTSRVENNGERVGVPFEWNSLSDSQRSILDSGARSGEKIVNFTRGDRSEEGSYGSFRDRVGLLGEIVHSNLYVWTYSNLPDPDEKKEALKVIYVGANDGMLHAFNAKTGVEVFAYVPSMLIGNLKENVGLRAPGPIDNFLPKPAYVDGQMAMASIHKPGAAAFQTVLVGALGAGGEGIYALDVSDPYGGGSDVSLAEKAKKKVMWEITSATKGFGNMGRIFGSPRIGYVYENGQKTPVVFVGNGYFNDDNKTSLFIIRLSDGGLIKEIKAPDLGLIATLSSLLKPSGLSTPTPHDRDGDGVTDYVYAGDPDGRLWKFDVRNLASVPVPVMLYQAKMWEKEWIDGVRTRPITTPPIVHYNAIKKKHMVIFGTGMLIRPAQLPLFKRNSLYGIVDENRTIDDNNLSPSILRSGLPGDAFEKYRVVFDGKRIFNMGSDDDGWYLHLPYGESILGFLPVSSAGRVYVTTDEIVGQSRLYVLDMSTGLAPGGCSVFDLDRDGKYCEILAGKNQVDHDDLMLANRIEGRTVEALVEMANRWGLDVSTAALDLELFPRDRKPIATELKRGIVSQPVLLSDGDGTVFPVFNWNSGRAQNIVDETKRQFVDGFRKWVVKNDRVEYSGSVDKNNNIVITMTLVGERRFCREKRRDCEYRKDIEQIKIEKDGTWLIKRRPDADGPLSNFKCFAHCDGDGLNRDVVGTVGNSTATKWKMHPGEGADIPIVERQSWRVVE